MRGADDFLSRWSRRKLEAKRPEADEAPPPAVDQDTGGASPAVDQEPATPAQTEALPDLPDPADLRAESDLSVFLREGIPERLRNAALRRMWSLDPSIRDFVGDARDYAFDWNDLGAVPGFGPILPGDDVEAMVAGIFGSRRPAGAETPDGGAEPTSPKLGASQSASAEAGATVNEGEGSQSPPEPGALPSEGADELQTWPAPPAIAPAAGEKGHEAATGSSEPSVRRHGGAKPV